MTESTNNTAGTLGPGSKPPEPKITELPDANKNLQLMHTDEEDEENTKLNTEK